MVVVAVEKAKRVNKDVYEKERNIEMLASHMFHVLSIVVYFPFTLMLFTFELHTIHVKARLCVNAGDLQFIFTKEYQIYSLLNECL